MHPEPFWYSFNGSFPSHQNTLLPSSNNFQPWYLLFIFFSCRSAWTSSHLSTFFFLTFTLTFFYFTLSHSISLVLPQPIIIPCSSTNSNLFASYYIYLLLSFRLSIVSHYYYSLDARVQKHLAAKRVFFSARPVRLYTSFQTI